MNVLNFTNMANSHIPQMEINERQKLPFSLLCCESEVILSKLKIFVSVTGRARVFIRENLHPSYREISVPASDMNTSRFLRMDE